MSDLPIIIRRQHLPHCGNWVDPTYGWSGLWSPGLVNRRKNGHRHPEGSGHYGTTFIRFECNLDMNCPFEALVNVEDLAKIVRARVKEATS